MISLNVHSPYRRNTGSSFPFLYVTNTHKVNKPFSSGACRSVQNHETVCVLLYDTHFWGSVFLKFVGAHISVIPKWEIGQHFVFSLNGNQKHSLVLSHIPFSYLILQLVIFMVLPFLPFQSMWDLSGASVSFSVCCLSCSPK